MMRLLMSLSPNNRNVVSRAHVILSESHGYSTNWFLEDSTSEGEAVLALIFMCYSVIRYYCFYDMDACTRPRHPPKDYDYSRLGILTPPSSLTTKPFNMGFSIMCFTKIPNSSPLPILIG
jgi:hypothetical protein